MLPDALDGVSPPERAPSLVGHSAVHDSLKAQLAAKRLPGAFLLHGPQGIGKATLAFTFAADVLTATGDEPEDRVKAQIEAGAHPNVLTLRIALNDSGKFYTVIRVEDVRHLRDWLHQTRGRAGYRVCIIDSIDDCNPSAANALLKILEEPPAETVFILVSHRPGALLPTIRSRCQAQALRPLSRAEVHQIVSAQMIDADPAQIDRAVDLSAGNPRRAFEALVLDELEALETLERWLADPLGHATGTHLDLAESLAKTGGPELQFARDLIVAWMAEEARTAAAGGAATRNRLASATELWDKAHDLFADADIYNLDMRQTLVSIFDTLKQHVERHAVIASAG